MTCSTWSNSSSKELSESTKLKLGQDTIQCNVASPTFVQMKRLCECTNGNETRKRQISYFLIIVESKKLLQELLCFSFSINE